MFLYDFMIFYLAGKAIWAGTSPYAIFGFIGPYPLAVLFAPMALLPLPAAYGLYLAFNLYMMWRLLQKRAIWALLSFPILFTLFVGQVDLPLVLTIGMIPWLLPLAISKPQVAFILAPWLLKHYSKQDWMRACAVGTGFLALSFILRPGWVNEWLAVMPTFHHYTQRATNLYYLIPREWIDVRLILTYVLSIAAFIAAFFMIRKSNAWTTIQLFAPLSTVYSSVVLIEWIGPAEVAASYIAVILSGGTIHNGMPLYLIGLTVLVRQNWLKIRRGFILKYFFKS